MLLAAVSRNNHSQLLGRRACRHQNPSQDEAYQYDRTVATRSTATVRQVNVVGSDKNKARPLSTSHVAPAFHQNFAVLKGRAESFVLQAACSWLPGPLAADCHGLEPLQGSGEALLRTALQGMLTHAEQIR